MQPEKQGLGAATPMAISGIDLALWDIRAKDAGQPLRRMLGGGARPRKPYARGVAPDWQEPAALASEACRLVAKGYRALKLRIGRSPRVDIASVGAVRENAGYFESDTPVGGLFRQSLTSDPSASPLA